MCVVFMVCVLKHMKSTSVVNVSGIQKLAAMFVGVTRKCMAKVFLKWVLKLGWCSAAAFERPDVLHYVYLAR